ncbi:hypothetical protein B0I33_11261 [Prauserella shujinwangii]|uniref:DUF7847 domain-containing protein n=1 Tax=Prauserella shujinwangii TaxID=1453103 RepID=A0A2T0LM75_9PSEU|nr:hypothetical protein [Prauserella shujinwangii]PRX44183.1 hypothetical protein B0I33_11261 [Prauserella shujinwangii]
MTDSTGWSTPNPDDDPRHGQGPQGQYPRYPGQPEGSGAGGAGGPLGHGKPGVIPLRPLGLGEILDGAITTMRKHAGVVFGSSAIVAVISAALYLITDFFVLDSLNQVVTIDQNASPEEQLDQAFAAMGDSLATNGVAALITLLTQTFLAGFLTVVAGKAVLGKPIGAGEAWAELRPRLLPLFGLTVVVTLIVMVGLILCILPGIWLWVLFGLATPALILERGSIGQSLGRSRLLVRGAWWRVFGVLLLAMVITTLIALVIGVPFSAMGGAFSTAELSFGDMLIIRIGDAIAQTITVPFVALVTALLYIDQRMRKEGLDLELARAAGTA